MMRKLSVLVHVSEIFVWLLFVLAITFFCRSGSYCVFGSSGEMTDRETVEVVVSSGESSDGKVSSKSKWTRGGASGGTVEYTPVTQRQSKGAWFRGGARGHTVEYYSAAQRQLKGTWFRGGSKK